MSNKPLACKPQASYKSFTPQYHQTRVTQEFLNTSKRGLLFYHALGSGKCVLPETDIQTSIGVMSIEMLWKLLKGDEYNEYLFSTWKILERD